MTLHTKSRECKVCSQYKASSSMQLFAKPYRHVEIVVQVREVDAITFSLLNLFVDARLDAHRAQRADGSDAAEDSAEGKDTVDIGKISNLGKLTRDGHGSDDAAARRRDGSLVLERSARGESGSGGDGSGGSRE